MPIMPTSASLFLVNVHSTVAHHTASHKVTVCTHRAHLYLSLVNVHMNFHGTGAHHTTLQPTVGEGVGVGWLSCSQMSG